MIVNLRGANGSGKSYIARAVISALAPLRQPERLERPGGRSPDGYRLRRPDGSMLSIIGHYECASGGCDRVSPLERVFELIKSARLRGDDVFCEGILLGHDIRRFAELHHAGEPLVVIFIDVPWETCIEDIMARRATAGNLKPFDQTRTRREYDDMARYHRRLREQGVDVRRLDRLDARLRTFEALGIAELFS